MGEQVRTNGGDTCFVNDARGVAPGRPGRHALDRGEALPVEEAMTLGRHPASAQAGGDSPRFTDDGLKTIASPLDFVGINVYRPGWYIEASDEPPGYREIPINASQPKMESSWHVFDPEVMYWAPKQMQSIWGATSIYVTENGCAAADVVAEDGRVYDTDRVMFLRTCLGQLQRATSEGVLTQERDFALVEPGLSQLGKRSRVRRRFGGRWRLRRPPT